MRSKIPDYQKSHQRCGEILYQATLVEQEIDSFLTAYFTQKPKYPEDQRMIDLFSFIAEVPFDKKKREVERVLKTYDKEYKIAITNIEKVQKIRNIVAHKYRSLTPEKLFKNRRPLYQLTEETITIDDETVREVFEAALEARKTLATHQDKFSRKEIK